MARDVYSLDGEECDSITQNGLLTLNIGQFLIALQELLWKSNVRKKFIEKIEVRVQVMHKFSSDKNT